MKTVLSCVHLVDALVMKVGRAVADHRGGSGASGR
jgi:hypothetical protein